jgi:hypothetical protein
MLKFHGVNLDSATCPLAQNPKLSMYTSRSASAATSLWPHSATRLTATSLKHAHTLPGSISYGMLPALLETQYSAQSTCPENFTIASGQQLAAQSCACLWPSQHQFTSDLKLHNVCISPQCLYIFTVNHVAAATFLEAVTVVCSQLQSAAGTPRRSTSSLPLATP